MPRLLSKFPIVIIGLVILIIIFHFLGFLSPLENLLLVILKPGQNLTYSLAYKIGNLKDYLVSKPELIHQNQELEREVRRLLIENTQLRWAQRENLILKKELNFLEQTDFEWVIARVIGQTSQLGSKVFILDKGSENGIKKGCPVVVEEGILIGKIIETKKNTSLFLPLTSVFSLLTAAILDKEGEQIKGLVKGEHDLTMKMELVPLNKPIQINDLVTSSGLEENIPRGLLIGQIKEVKISEDTLFQEARVKPAILPEENEIVAVIK